MPQVVSGTSYIPGFVLWAVVGLLCSQIARLPGKGWLTAGFLLLSVRSLLYIMSSAHSSSDDPAMMFGPWLVVGAVGCCLIGVIVGGAGQVAGSASLPGIGGWWAGLPGYAKAAGGVVVLALLAVLVVTLVAYQHDRAIREKDYPIQEYDLEHQKSNAEGPFQSVPSERDGPPKDAMPADPAVDASPAERRDKASALEVKAEDLRLNGDKPLAKDDYRQAIHILDKLVEDFSDNPDYRFGSAVDCRALGDLEADGGNNDAATTAYSKAQTYLEKLVADHPGNATYGTALADLYEVEGKFFANTDRKGDSEDAFAKAAKLRESLPKDPDAKDKDKP